MTASQNSKQSPVNKPGQAGNTGHAGPGTNTPPAYQNILVINLMHIGDLMLVTPVLRTLRTNYPQARITMLTDKGLRELVEHNAHINECLLIEKHGKDDGIAGLWCFIRREIRPRHFDLVINLHRNERASAIAAFSGAQRIVGYAKPGFALFFDKVLQNPSVAHHVGRGPGQLLPPFRYVPGWKHQVTAHLEVLTQAVGVTQIDDGGLEMWLPPEREAEAAALWAQTFQPEDRVVAFNIGASWPTKRWLDSSFAACADQLIARGYHVAFFGGPMDREMVDACVAQMAEKDSAQLHIFTGKVNLAVLAGLLRRCCLMLTTDSGPMHIGVAMNVPIVTMFGASPVPGFYPYDAKDVLIRAPEPCHPCGQHTCPRAGEENLACMKRISVATVMHYVDELLTRFGAQPACKLPDHYGEYQCRIVDADFIGE